MDKLFAFFIEKWRLTLTFTIIIVVIGLTGLKSLNRETFPPVNFAMVEVSTVYPGASSVEVDDNVTQVIEEQIQTVSGVKDVRSLSQSGRSRIIVRIDMDHENVDDVIDELESAVNKAGPLPTGLLNDPDFSELNSKEIPILQLALVGPNDKRQRDALIDILKDRVESVDGVARVNLSGYNDREFQIRIDRKKLEELHVGIPEVVNAVRNRVKDTPAGKINNGKKQKLVRVLGKVQTAEELKNIVIRSNFEGEKVLVKDIAEVVDLYQDPMYLVSYNQKPGALFTISKKESSDAIKTVNLIYPIIDQFKKELPQGFDLIEYNNESKRIADKLSIVTTNAIVGFVLVIFFLLLFLPGVVGVVTSVSLPVAVLVTIGVMPLLGVNFNTVTMLALIIALGMLVDNSIVISENYTRLRHEGVNQLEAAKKAVAQFWLPITATAFTTIAAFLPMLVTKGIMGQFIKYIPIVVTIALATSLVESFFLLPTRLRFTLFDKNLNAKKNSQTGGGSSGTMHIDWFSKVQIWFEDFIYKSTKHRYITFSIITLLLVSSILVNVFLNRFELFPRNDVEFYVAKVQTEEGTTIDETLNLSQTLGDKIREKIGQNNIKSLIVKVGNSQVDALDSEAKYGDNIALIRVTIPLEVAKKQKAEKVLSELRSIDTSLFENVTFEALAPGPPVGKALELTLSSADFTELLSAVKDFKLELKKIDGTFDIADDNIAGAEEVTFDIDHEKLAAINLSLADVGLNLRSALEGAIASEVNVEGKEVKVRVKYSDKDKKDVDAIENTNIMDSRGNLIPINKIAKVKLAPGPAQRKNYEYQRAITVSADVDNVKMTAVKLNGHAEKIKETIGKKYPGVTFSFLGQAESTKESVTSLFQAMILAVLGILVILVFLFDSFAVPIIVLSTIPLGLVGVSYAFFFHGKPLDFFALIGVVGLAGVVVNSAIVLISYMDDLKKEGNLSGEKLLAHATASRLRAVLVTTLTTVGGLLPTAYGIGGYDPILVPLTLALAWGLISGTILTLIWVPSCVAILEDIEKRILKPLFAEVRMYVTGK